MPCEMQSVQDIQPLIRPDLTRGHFIVKGVTHKLRFMSIRQKNAIATLKITFFLSSIIGDFNYYFHFYLTTLSICQWSGVFYSSSQLGF